MRVYISGLWWLSNIFWVLVVMVGGLGFFLIGLLSYFNVNLLIFLDVSNIVFIL